MDQEADRIRALIVDTCAGARSEDALTEARADLLALSVQTADGEAADDACQQAREIDVVLGQLATTDASRRAS